MEDLEFIKCYYRPSFFQMKIDLPVDLGKLGEATDGTLSLYLHEYIHFIQDISTIYGLMNISTINYYIQDCASRIYKEGNKAFEVPQHLKSREGDSGFLNFNLRPIYLGSKINPKYKRIEIVSYSWGKENIAKNSFIDRIDVTIRELEYNNEIDISLGGNLITEGMAYLAERYVYSEILESQGHTIEAYDYPYSVVEKIVQYIYPELAQYHILLIAICDCSLMTYHPGLSFIRVLEYLKECKFIEKNIEDENIISTLYNEASILLKGNHVDFDVILENVRDSVKKSFKVEHFEGNNKWVDILFDRIKSFRNNRPEFITEFLQFGDLKKNEFFGIFHKLLGSPLVLNSEYEGTITLPDGFVPDNFHPHLFWAINQMLRIFSNNNPTPCELKEYCIKSKEVEDPNIVIDERCDNAPWTRYGDKDLCPMGVMWKHWALSEFYPNKK
jgi:hypothetical protein